MDLLQSAVVDITMLVATSRALRSVPLLAESEQRRRPLHRLRAELRRACLAYIDTLARSKRGEVDDRLLASCRAGAEQEMPQALRRHEALKQLMNNEPGVLAGVAVIRQDLWRLAHMGIHLRRGAAAMRDTAAKKLAARLRRRFRRALIAYARVCHRHKDGADQLIVAAREAALNEIGKRGAEGADRLVLLEANGATQTIITMGVVKPLHDLIVDWARSEK